MCLGKKKLFSNLKKYTYIDKLVVSAYEIQVDEEKVCVIQEWPSPTSINSVRIFIVLPSFYSRFIKYFSTFTTPLIEVIKENTFQMIKQKLTNAPLLSLPNVNKMFEIKCDASGIGIGTILM